MNEIIEDILFGTAMFFGGIALGVIGIRLYDTSFQPLSKMEYSNCSGLNLLLTSECLNNDLKGWINYNLTNMNKEMNLSELKEIGGVCSHYAEWYKDNYINLGFNAKTISLFGDDTGHKFTLSWTKNLSDGEGTYCIADQSMIHCENLEEVNMTRYKELTK